LPDDGLHDNYRPAAGSPVHVRGADVAKAMAWPVFGGMLVELLTLFVVPVVYCGFKGFKRNLGLRDRDWQAEATS